MKLFNTVLAVAIAAPTLALADPIFGLWKTVTEDNKYAYIEMAPCGDKICGVINKTFANGKEVSDDMLGQKIVWELESDGGAKYSGGRILRPTDGKTYNLKMNLSGNDLSIRGCFLGICQDGGTWKRVK